MNRTTLKAAIGAGVAAVVVGITATGIAGAAGPGEDSADVPLTGTDLARAGEAALAETGGGEVVDSEAEDEEGGYEVEVNLSDGRQLEVQLDENFAVVGSSENEEGDDGDAD